MLSEIHSINNKLIKNCVDFVPVYNIMSSHLTSYLSCIIWAKGKSKYVIKKSQWRVHDASYYVAWEAVEVVWLYNISVERTRTLQAEVVSASMVLEHRCSLGCFWV